MAALKLKGEKLVAKSMIPPSLGTRLTNYGENWIKINNTSNRVVFVAVATSPNTLLTMKRAYEGNVSMSGAGAKLADEKQLATIVIQRSAVQPGAVSQIQTEHEFVYVTASYLSESKKKYGVFWENKGTKRLTELTVRADHITSVQIWYDKWQ